MYDHKINFYIMNGSKIGVEVGMGPTRINTILQSAFFSITKIIPEEDAIKFMKDAAQKTYGRKGQDVVEKNWAAIDAGADPKNLIKVEIPESWKDAKDEGLDFPKATKGAKDAIDFVNNIQIKVSAQEGNTLKVSDVLPYQDGSTPSGTAAYEKRGIAVNVPAWDPTSCIQCTFCSLVCPHAAIRPVALTADEAAKAPASLKTTDMKQMDGYKFAIVISALDCTGCGSCTNVCPGNKKGETLKLSAIADNMWEQEGFDYAVSLPTKTDVVEKFKESTIKGSQFKKPLLEFSGACAGCGETPYLKLATQLFGDRMYIANATGCTSIWGNSSPSTPYTKADNGHGVAWDNSLFEDNAEFGFGMVLAQNALRDEIKEKAEHLAEAGNAAAKEYLDTFIDGATNTAATEKLLASIASDNSEDAAFIKENKDFASKKSQWIVGGDGWGFDIGYGGLDHVLASGKDVNVLVVNTEVYSNTGGQSSKATPIGAVAQFAAGGKAVKQKDLAAMAMSYGYVYVAQIAMGANMNQTLQALREAEAYHGPSLVIAYAPCINHGIKVNGGMKGVMTEEKRAVDCGYFNIFRFNPAAEGKKLTVDFTATKPEEYQDFLNGEVRYLSLKKSNPAHAEEMYAANAQNAKDHLNYLQRLEKLYDPAQQ
jgi:pyruvate-ferredoxin/flavodoxin oxidoreductase